MLRMKEFNVSFENHEVVYGKAFFDDAVVSTLKGSVEAFVLVLPKSQMTTVGGTPQPDGTLSDTTQWIGISRKNKDGESKGVRLGNYWVRVSITEAEPNVNTEKEDIFSSEGA